jgi:hypothetical protein
MDTYSAHTQKISLRPFIDMADAVLDKDASYVQYKDTVDNLLRERAMPGYFIAAINRELGPKAALVPKVVPKTLRAFRKRSTGSLEGYAKLSLKKYRPIAARNDDRNVFSGLL